MKLSYSYFVKVFVNSDCDNVKMNAMLFFAKIKLQKEKSEATPLCISVSFVV